jgi:hypothetical protein
MHYAREKKKGNRSMFQDDICYEHLRSIVDDHLNENECDNNLAAQEAEFEKLAMGFPTKAQIAAAPAPKAKAKANAKGKAKAKPKANPNWKPKGADDGTRTPRADRPERTGATFDPKDDPQRRCFFHTLGTCNKGDGCSFLHEKIPAAEFATWKYPVKNMSSKGTPRQGGGKGGTPRAGTPTGGGKGDGKGKSKGKKGVVTY